MEVAAAVVHATSRTAANLPTPILHIPKIANLAIVLVANDANDATATHLLLVALVHEAGLHTSSHSYLSRRRSETSRPSMPLRAGG